MSRRHYLTLTQLAEYADVEITDNAEAIDRIEQAEELIDSFVGFQEKAIPSEILGRAVSGTTGTLTLETDQQNTFYEDYFKYCIVEIIGGTGIGQTSPITASSYAGVITFDTMTTAPDGTSYYRIYQLSKFPRIQDVYFDSTYSKYNRFIPEAVVRATAAQVQYVIEMGDNFFSTNKGDMQSESIGNYSYTKMGGGSDNQLIAPKAKLLLKGITNRKGKMTAI
jgi:hypothetical protein